MNAEHSDHSGEHKSWLDRISHFLTGEPQDTEDLLVILREARNKHLLDNYGLSMIEGVLQVSELRARDIMIPRAQMVVVPQDSPLDEVLPLIVESAHSRFPVIGEDRSEVVGILLAKDLLPHLLKPKALKVREIMRSAHFIPESKRLNVLLKEFRTQRHHMAIVVDEYGMAAGLVTIEDILEQIVGEIEDEHDMDEESYVFQRNEREFTVKALMPIDEFNKFFNADLYDDEFDTIGGLLLHQLEHLPKKGERVDLGRFRFEVLQADSRRVHLLKLKILSPPGQPLQSNDSV